MIQVMYLYGWLIVRPRRWFFGNMGRAAYIRWLPTKEWYGWRWPNVHWHILYLTIFRFCKWLYWDGWRPFAVWGPRMLERHTWLSFAIKALGRTTAGAHLMDVECYHCGSPEGSQVDLADDETGMTFILTNSGVSSTPEGVDHWFEGITICPKCGYRDNYGDGSL